MHGGMKIDICHAEHEAVDYAYRIGSCLHDDNDWPAYTAQDVHTCAHLNVMVPTAQQSSSHSQLAAMLIPH